MINFGKDIILETQTVLLRPVLGSDSESLKQIAFDPDIWKFTVTIIKNEIELTEYIQNSVNTRQNNERYTFAIISKKTDVLNLQSRKALLKIGAVEEGVLRSHTQMHSNRRRDAIFYGILKNEWGNLKSKIFNEFLNQ